MSRKLSTALKALTLISFLLLLLPWSSWLGVKMDIMNSLASPSLIHPLGTDSKREGIYLLGFIRVYITP